MPTAFPKSWPRSNKAMSHIEKDRNLRATVWRRIAAGYVLAIAAAGVIIYLS